MRIIIAVLLAVALLAPAATHAKKKEVVGGPCAYEEFGGFCTVSGRDKSGRSLFTYVGVVRDVDVNLEGNPMMEGMTMRKGSTPCKLLFITKGTCTPCAFSLGECGEQAWNVFRSTAKPKKKR